MKFLRSLLILLFLTCPAMAQEPSRIAKVKLPLEVKNEMQVTAEIPPEIEGLEWNRWTSENFTVLSLNNVQAEYLYKHLEQIKTWILARWGLYDIDFSAECKLICVDDPQLFEKLFKINTTRVEIRRNTDNTIKEMVIFLLINDSPSNTVPVPLTQVVMAEFQEKYNADFGWWSHRGMALLNGSLSQIRAELSELKPRLENNKPLYFSEGILTMKQDQYNRLNEENKQIYDQCVMCFCLMVRKEFGQDTYHQFLKKFTETDGQTAIKEVLKFDGYDDFDRTFKRFMLDLTRDILSGETPNSYLQIKPRDFKFSSSVFSFSS